MTFSLKPKNLVLLTIALTLSCSVAAPAALAYSIKSKGRPGKVRAFTVQGLHYNACTHTNLYTCYNPWVVASGPIVRRSPATSGKQAVLAVYELQRWDGVGWVHQSQRIHTRWLYRGQYSARLPRIDFLPTSGGEFRVSLVLGWGTPKDRPLGTRAILYREASDYTCSTQFPCSVGNGFVFLRSPGV